MIRKIGLEANIKLYRVLLLQGFATRSLRFKMFLVIIIMLFTAGARILFCCHKKSSHGVLCSDRLFELKLASTYMFHIIRGVPPFLYFKLPDMSWKRALKKFTVDSFARHKPGNLNITSSSFFKSFSIF